MVLSCWKKPLEEVAIEYVLLREKRPPAYQDGESRDDFDRRKDHLAELQMLYEEMMVRTGPERTQLLLGNAEETLRMVGAISGVTIKWYSGLSVKGWR